LPGKGAIKVHSGCGRANAPGRNALQFYLIDSLLNRTVGECGHSVI
jgi:hypothetical protein